MNKKTIYTRLLVFAVFFLTSLFNINAQTQLQKHIIKSGETLYRLSVNYGVSVDQILQYNPGVNQNNLISGNTILIPVVRTGNADNDPVKIKEVHKVKRRETLYSISKDFDISLEDLKIANPEMFQPGYELKKGMEINIPYPVKVQQHIEKPQKTIMHKGCTNVKIAIMLPFTSDAAGSNRCIEYYRGFLLAVEKLQNEGKNVEIYAFNEPHASHSIIMTLEAIRQKRVHLLVAPLYFEHFAAVSKFSKTNKIKTLIPFSSKVIEINDNPYLYLLNAPEEEKHEYASNLFLKNFENNKVVFISGHSHNERKFTQHLRSKLLENGNEISDIALNSSEARVANACNTQKGIVFVVDGSTDEDFDRTVPKIIQFKKSHPTIKCAFFAYPEWLKLASSRRNELHQTNTYLYTNAFYNPWSPVTNEIKRTYTEWFKSDIIDSTPRMFMLGYDSGLTFISGISTYGNNFNTQDQKLPLQQSDIVFNKISNNGGYINGSMWFVHYREDYQIEKVSER